MVGGCVCFDVVFYGNRPIGRRAEDPFRSHKTLCNKVSAFPRVYCELNTKSGRGLPGNRITLGST